MERPKNASTVLTVSEDTFFRIADGFDEIVSALRNSRDAINAWLPVSKHAAQKLEKDCEKCIALLKEYVRALEDRNAVPEWTCETYELPGVGEETFIGVGDTIFVVERNAQNLFVTSVLRLQGRAWDLESAPRPADIKHAVAWLMSVGAPRRKRWHRKAENAKLLGVETADELTLRALEYRRVVNLPQREVSSELHELREFDDAIGRNTLERRLITR
ncbi:MAG: hypothetical protein EON54_25515 [Alcaligenaceae bacterium]|nr:MAG: hypothetical protein EON54_25515 [Alcaligenaceae bacterium]